MNFDGRRFVRLSLLVQPGETLSLHDDHQDVDGHEDVDDHADDDNKDGGDDQIYARRLCHVYR